MPRGDKTGPTGMGPMTGRKAGYCNNSTTPGYENQTSCGGMRQRSQRRQSQKSGMGISRGNGQRGAKRCGCHRNVKGRGFQLAQASLGPVNPASCEETSLKMQVLALQTQLETLLNKINSFE